MRSPTAGEVGVAVTTPSFDRLRRVVDVLHGSEGQVIQSLATGDQPSAASLGIAESDYASAINALTAEDFVRPSIGPHGSVDRVELTERGLRLAQVVRELDGYGDAREV